jgi:CHAT domain
MAEPRKGSTLTIRIKTNDESYSLELEGYGGRAEILSDLAGKEKLWKMRQAAMASLAGFKKAAVAGSSSTYQGFSDLAVSLLSKLLGDRVNQCVSLFYDFVSECFLKWYASEEAAPRVTLEAPAESMVPIELLAFDGIGRPPPSGSTDPGYYNHLGFAAVVNRSFTRCTDISSSRIIQNVPQLPVMFLRNTALPGSGEEAEFLDGDDRIDLDGPWPDRPADISAGSDAVIASLYDPFRRLNGDRSLVAAQIQHLSCHGRFDPKDPDQSKLQLGCPDGTVSLILGQLEAEFTRLRILAEEAARDVPLVFLNACESVASAGYMSADSFPRHFSIWSSRAVLGAETIVPDTMAAAFSRLFYQGLLDAGLTVGEAILQARQRLLARDNPICPAVRRGSGAGWHTYLYGSPQTLGQQRSLEHGTILPATLKSARHA